MLILINPKHFYLNKRKEKKKKRTITGQGLKGFHPKGCFQEKKTMYQC